MARIIDTAELPLDQLRPHPHNARTHELAIIRDSLERHGQYRSIVARRAARGRHTILAGHGLWEAARELGWEQLLVDLVDCTADEAQRILLIDNRASDLGGYDDTKLADLLGELPDLGGTGYEESALADLQAQIQALEAADHPPDEAPEPPAEPTTKPGDLWVLGEHRLLCGSSTDPAAVERVLAGDGIDLVVTDPPYGVAYQADLTRAQAKALRRRADGLEVSNDALGVDGTRQLIADALTLAALKAGGAYYVCGPPGGLDGAFEGGLADAGLPARHHLVWVKDRFVLGRSDYHYRHEAIYYGWRDGGAHYFIADRTQDSVWDCPRPSRSDEHPTMKPIELFARMVRNSSKAGECVYDPFAGSGTAAMACEAEGRRARLMEIDPRYCDVIVRRWEQFTGKEAVLDGAQDR